MPASKPRGHSPVLTTLVRVSRPVRYRWDKISYRRSGQAERLRALKNQHFDQPMLVVGNGPSLNNTPLSKFTGVHAIGMNKISLLFPRTDWRPSYIVAVNGFVMKQHADFFRRTDLPLLISWKGRGDVPPESKSSPYYLLELSQRDFSIAIDHGVGVGDTVTYTALQLAYYLGANPVILVGVDHSFSVTGPANKYVKAEGPDLNHFDESYFEKGSVWGLPNLPESELAYHRAKAAFEQEGREILDATVGGKLDVFPKVSIPEALDLVRMARS